MHEEGKTGAQKSHVNYFGLDYAELENQSELNWDPVGKMRERMPPPFFQVNNESNENTKQDFSNPLAYSGLCCKYWAKHRARASRRLTLKTKKMVRISSSLWLPSVWTGPCLSHTSCEIFCVPHLPQFSITLSYSLSMHLHASLLGREESKTGFALSFQAANKNAVCLFLKTSPPSLSLFLSESNAPCAPQLPIFGTASLPVGLASSQVMKVPPSPYVDHAGISQPPLFPLSSFSQVWHPSNPIGIQLINEFILKGY